MKQEKKHRRKLTHGKLYAVVLAVVVLCCIMLSVLEARNDWGWDITAGDIYTLSEETLDVLENTDDTINIYTLYSLGNYNKTILTLLEKYQFYCKNITVSNIDPTGDRLALKELEGIDDIINEGSLIVADEQTGRSRVIDADELYLVYDKDTYFLAENRITDAIDYCATGEFRRLLMTVGHRETAVDDLEKFVKRMTMNNYIVEEYDYLHTAAAPDPATDIILSVSPEEDYTETEAQSIRDFVDNGGTYILLHDYAEYDEELGSIRYPDADMPQLNALIRGFGMQLGKGVIAGNNAGETGFRNTVVEVDPVDAAMPEAVFSESTFIGEFHSAEYTAQPLLVTSEDCVLQVENSSEKPPYTTAMLSTGGKGIAAVFGTSSFIGDTELSVLGNEELIDRVLERSASGYPRRIVPAKRVKTDELSINSMLVKTTLTVFVLLIVPCGILAVGIITVRRRRQTEEIRETE